jgi:hypothetical protein
MRNILLAMLTAGLLVFSGVSCVASANATATPEVAVEKPGNYIGMKVLEVMKKIGSPDSTGVCHILLPYPGKDFEIDMTVRGDGAMWHESGVDENHVIRTVTQLCAVYGIVVSDQRTIADRQFIEGESLLTMGYTDYILLRKILEAGPTGDGTDGEYILKPGEMAI